MTVTCTYDGKSLKSCKDPLDGTRARFQCAQFYEAQGFFKFPVRVCSNGQWSGGLPECVPGKFLTHCSLPNCFSGMKIVIIMKGGH